MYTYQNTTVTILMPTEKSGNSQGAQNILLEADTVGKQTVQSVNTC